MKRDLLRLASKKFDVLVIGGGVQGAAIVNSDRTCRPHEISRLCDINFTGVLLAQTTGPVSVGVILIVKRPVVTVRQDGQRAIRHIGVRQITANGEDVVYS